MKWIFQITKQQYQYYLYIFLMTIGDLSTILPPIFFGMLVDEFVLHGANSNIWSISFIVFSIIFIGANSAFIGVIQANKFRNHLNSSIRKACYTHLNGLDRNFHFNNNIGEVTTMITTDLNSIGHFMVDTIKNLLYVIISFIAVFVYCVFVRADLTLLILFPAPLIGLLSYFHMKRIPPLYDDRREQRKKINDYISEALEGFKVIKVLATEDRDKKHLNGLNKELTKRSLRLETVRQNYDIKVSILSESMNFILILVGGLFLINDLITLGDLVVFRSYLWILRGPFTRLAYYIDDYQEFKLSSAKLKGLLDTKPIIKDDGKKKLRYKGEDIVFDNVSVKFDGLDAVKNINLTIKEGSTIACIGEVGSGKSTIINLLLRFVEPSEGTIFFGKADYRNYSLESLRNNFGYVSQTPFLFSDTIKNNVNYGNLKLSEKDILKYLKMAKADYVFEYDEGINTVIGENGVNLSGGEKQRLSLARALATNPKILILDDITSALDIETEVSVTKNIENKLNRITKIIIAQKIFSVRNADQILVFKDNKIVEMGTHKELLKKNGEYKKIYDINEAGDEDGN